MLAAFLKNSDGDFDYPAAMLSLFFVFAVSGTLCGFFRAFKTGRILFSWSFKYGGSGQFYVDKKGNPSGFWLVFTLYCLGIILLIASIIVVCFGLLRTPS
jgi:hypothetical protein